MLLKQNTKIRKIPDRIGGELTLEIHWVLLNKKPYESIPSTTLQYHNQKFSDIMFFRLCQVTEQQAFGFRHTCAGRPL